MSDYNAVRDALANGSDPAMLCATCPWDRHCITPPTMTKADIDAQMSKSMAQDEENRLKAAAEGKPTPMPVGALMTALTFGARDMQAHVCPVFALRLRSGAGRRIAEDIRQSMQEWDDQS